MKNRLLAFGRAFLNLIYPLSCLTCGKKITENKGLCSNCASLIQKNDYGVAACRYEGILKQAIRLFKYKGIVSLLNTFSGLLIDFLDKNIDMKKIDKIIPMPLHPVKHRERGFNQAYLLCLPVAKKYHIPISSTHLIKKKATASQSVLSRAKRLKNLNNAFTVRKSNSLKGKNILLVDDVYTTGATINQASKVLKKVGVATVKVATLARGI